jgi:hypothetical protein
MEKIRAVDALLIRLNEQGDEKDQSGDLKASYRDLRQAAQVLLTSTT